MLYALLILGLIPAVLLPDFLAEQDDGADRGDHPEEPLDVPANLLDDLPEPVEEVLIPLDEDDLSGDPGDDEPALLPLDEDDVPEPEVTVLDPVIEDDQPSTAPPDDPIEVQEPIIEDDTDQGYADPDPDDVLPPVIEDDVASDAAGQEPLPPVHEIEASEHGAWLDASDLASGSYAEISGFEVGTDVLHITFDPDHDLPDLDVTLRASEDGEDSEILIGGTLIAVLLDAADVPVEDIIVTIERLH